MMDGYTDDEGKSNASQSVEKLSPENIKAEKRKIIKNLLIMSSAFLFLFTAFQSLSNLQSSLNSDEGLGLASLCIIYASLIISCMFVPPIVINKLGCKWTVAVSMACYVTYTAANYYSSWYTLVPTSALLGFAAAPLWSAKCSYLTTTGIKYAEMSNESSDDVITRFFGIFFLIFQTGQVWGNLISSLVLKPTSTNSSVTEKICGAQFCPAPAAKPTGNVTAPSSGPAHSTIITLMSIYLATGICAVLIISFLLDKVNVLGSEKRKGVCNLFIATLKHLKDNRMKLLVPLTVYSGLEQGFVFGDFTKSYVTCALGIEKVGFVMICFGVTDAIFSLSLGKLSQYTGRPALMLGGALINMALIITLLVWKPSTDSLPVFFVAAGAWGFADAIWQTQVNAFYGVLFSDNQEAAFSNYRLWESIGFVIAFAYSNFLCVNVKLYILISVLTIAITLYGIIELKERRKGDNYTVSMQALAVKS